MRERENQLVKNSIFTVTCEKHEISFVLFKLKNNGSQNYCAIF